MGPLPTYYGIPTLKKPKWGWEIAFYFFFEGISAGCYVLGTMADLFAHGRHKPLVRNARYVALAAFLPCPVLLVADLGRPERFLHMLRIFKWTAPMSHGSWALTGYGPFAAFQALFPTRAAGAAGIPFAMTMLAYPGVLLSATSTPVWSHTRVLGAMFACSSMSSAAAVLSLAAPETKPVHRVETLARIGEAAALATYVATAGPAAKPLISGGQSGKFWLAVVGGILLPALLPRRSRAAALMTIGGSLLLKWAVTYAGQESADNPTIALYSKGASASPVTPPESTASATPGAEAPSLH